MNALNTLLESTNLIAKAGMQAGMQAGVDIERKESEARIAQLTKRLATLEGTLQEVLEFLDDQADVVDGDYGEQKPNRAMALATQIRFDLGLVP